MTGLFLKIVNMSIAASWLVAAVLILRLIFKKAPKWVSVLLWGIVALRLVLPFSIESVLSLIPSAQTLPEKVILGPSFNVQTGISPVDNRINDYLGDRYFEGVTVPANNGNKVMTILTVVWIIGIFILFAYTIISYLHLYRKINTAVRFDDNIFQSENVGSPFVLGIIKPKIYLPFNMSQDNITHVVAHEAAHIRRRDHWWKPLGFLLLTVHWFNPLMWLGYILLCRDIELACDEKVIKELGSEQRADYTQALVNCSVNRRMIAACPLAFGEVGIKDRVKSVMNYKKSAFWVIILALLACSAAAVCFLTDPKTEVPSIFGTVYKPVGVIYESGSAAVEDISYIILDEGTAFSIDGVPRGSMHEFELTKDNFYNYFRPNKAPKVLKRGVLGSWRCITADSGDMHYLIQTKDALYLAAGWFDEEGLQDPYSDDSSFHSVMLLEETEPQPDGVIFTGTILALEDGSLLVSPQEGWPGNSESLIRVPIANMPASPAPCVGATVKIHFNGFIRESSPAQLGEIYSVTVIKEDAIVEIFHSSMKDASLTVTDFVLATDGAEGLHAVVQYEDGLSHAWRLGFIKDGVSFPVAIELKEQHIIAGILTYQGNGTVSVMIKDTENDARYEYTMSFSSDEDGVNFVSGVNEIVPPRSDELTDIAEPSLNLATLKDLVSHHGIYLTWEDFAPYYGEDVGSGLYIMHYVLAEDDYSLYAGGSPSFDPMYIRLVRGQGDKAISIDVRLGDIDAFLQGEIVYNWDTLFELYYGEDGVPVPVQNLLAMNRDAALRYCFERFDEGVLEGLTLEGKSIYNAMYDFFCSSKSIGEHLENVFISLQQEWLDWSGHVKNLYARNGLSDVVFNEDSYCSRIYAQMLEERSQKAN